MKLKQYYFLLIVLNYIINNLGAKCGSGNPCIFVNKDIGWIERNESNKQYKPPSIKTNSWKDLNTKIFIGISSFRDKLCPITLYNMYTKAKYPNRLITAVIQQNIPGDIDCYEEYCNLMKIKENPSNNLLDSWKCPYSENIKMRRLDGNTARGPTWARAHASAMIDDEEFCLQTDSHMDFEIDWDVLMLNMWALIDNEYGILSTYVTDSTDFDNIKDRSKGIYLLIYLSNF